MNHLRTNHVINTKHPNSVFSSVFMQPAAVLTKESHSKIYYADSCCSIGAPSSKNAIVSVSASECRFLSFLHPPTDWISNFSSVQFVLERERFAYLETRFPKICAQCGVHDGGLGNNSRAFRKSEYIFGPHFVQYF